MIELPIGPRPAISLRASGYETQVLRTAFDGGTLVNSKFTQINWAVFFLRPSIDPLEIGYDFVAFLRISPLHRPYPPKFTRPRRALVGELYRSIIMKSCDQISVMRGQYELINSSVL